MKIYVASSWRNQYYESLLAYLREVCGALFAFYDFRNPEEGNNGFSWRELEADGVKFESWGVSEYLHALEHPIAERGFQLDFNAMLKADACILVLPCGRSAHLEAGFFLGQRKPVLIYIPEQIEPELMYKMTPHIFTDRMHLTERLKLLYLARNNPFLLAKEEDLQKPVDKSRPFRVVESESVPKDKAVLTDGKSVSVLSLPEDEQKEILGGL